MCGDAGDYPHGIVTALMTQSLVPVPFWKTVEVRGVLRLREHIDPETGCASPLRLEEVTVKVFQIRIRALGLQRIRITESYERGQAPR